MEKGLIFALLAAVIFAASAVTVRKGMAQVGESFTGVVISVLIGIPFFAASIFLSGEWSKLWYLSGQGFILLGIAGIIHFVAGRLFTYNAYRLIGANKAATFGRTTPIYAVILGVLFLNESLTIFLIFGVLCIIGGAILVSTERKSVSEEKQIGFRGTEVKGILAALGGALCWGISPVLIKPAVEEVGSPSVAAFVSFVAASIIMACLLFRRQHREQIVQLRSLTTLTFLVISGIFACIAQLFRYAALGYSPVSMVTPIVTTSIFFVFLFSFLLNRNIEIFTLKVILGMVAMVIGAFLIFY